MEEAARCSNCARLRNLVEGRCGSCRQPSKNLQYPWTPEMDELLIAVYNKAISKRDLSLALTTLSVRFDRPRYILSNRAQSLGLRTRKQVEWSDAELDNLRMYAGVKTVKQIARILGRTHAAVKNKLHQMQLSGALDEGLSRNQLAQYCGVHHSQIERWIRKGWLWDGENGLIAQASIEMFVWNHFELLTFARCEEWWLKETLKAGKAKASRPVRSIHLAMERVA